MRQQSIKSTIVVMESQQNRNQQNRNQQNRNQQNRPPAEQTPSRTDPQQNRPPAEQTPNRNHPNRRNKTMTTETRNPNTMDLDIMSPLEVVTAMNREDEKVPREVEAA